jgi:hypothetical protein
MPFTVTPRRWPRQRGIPDKTWREAKAAAALAGISQDQWMTQALDMAVALQQSGEWQPVPQVNKRRGSDAAGD